MSNCPADGDAGVRYRDKVTIVTGGSRGIGQACVELFGKYMYIVSVADSYKKKRLSL